MFQKFSFFSAIALFAVLALSGCGGDVTDSDSASVETNEVEASDVQSEIFSEEEVALPEDTFTYDSVLGYYGGILLEGYLSVDTSACAFQDISVCKIDVAWFHFDNPGNDFFRQFVEEGIGNSFLATGAISLGCYDPEANRIYYSNAADAEDSPMGAELLNGEVTGEAFAVLMSTRDQSKSVNLWVEKPVLTSGKGADDCYSHFRNFEVIE